MTNNKEHNDGTGQPVRCSAWLGRMVNLLSEAAKETPQQLIAWCRMVFRVKPLDAVQDVGKSIIKLRIGYLLILGQCIAQAGESCLAEKRPGGVNGGRDGRGTLIAQSLALVCPLRNLALPTRQCSKVIILAAADTVAGVTPGHEPVGKISGGEGSNWQRAYQELQPFVLMLSFLAGWVTYEIRDDIRHWWRRRMRPNDPSSATRREGGVE